MESLNIKSINIKSTNIVKRIGAVILALALVVGFVSVDATKVYAYPTLPGVGNNLFCDGESGTNPVKITKVNPVVIQKTNDWTDSLIVYCYEYYNHDCSYYSEGIGSVGRYDMAWYTDKAECYTDEDGVFNYYATLDKGEINDLMEYTTIRWASSPDTPFGCEVEYVEYIDRDTYKTCLPARTVIANVPGNPKQLYELKVHPMSEQDTINQRLLVQAYAANLGKKTTILAEYGIFPRRDLAISEQGLILDLTWKNLEKNKPGEVIAACYNQTDGVYYIKGYIDEYGKAVFSGYKLREATNITIFRCI